MVQALYGPIEIEYYQITPIGIQRLQSGFGHLDPGVRSILFDLYEMGGTAELDELKFGGGSRPPTLLRAGLEQLIDMGLVVPVTAGTQTAPAAS